MNPAPDCSPLVSSVSAGELGEGPSSKDERVIGMVLCVNHQTMVKHQTCIIHSWREWVWGRGMGEGYGGGVCIWCTFV